MDVSKLTLKEPNTVDDGESSENFFGQTLNQQYGTDVLLLTNESPKKNGTEKKTFKRRINLDENAPLDICEDQQQCFAGEFVKEQFVMDPAKKVCFRNFVLQSDACFAGLGEEDKIILMLSKIKNEEFIAKEFATTFVRLKSSIVFDIIPQDDKSNIVEMETTVRDFKVGSLVWGPSKLIDCGDGIRKLRICCDLQQSETSVSQLIEFIEEIKKLGLNVDIVGFKGPTFAIFKHKERLFDRMKVAATTLQHSDSDKSTESSGLMNFEEFAATMKSNKTINFDEGSEDLFNLVLNQEYDADVTKSPSGRIVKCTTDQAPTEKNVIEPLNTASLSEEEEAMQIIKEMEKMKKIRFEKLAAKLRKKHYLALRGGNDKIMG